MKTASKILVGASLVGAMGLTHAAPITLDDTKTFNQSLSAIAPFNYAHSNPFSLSDLSLYDFLSATLTLTLAGQGSNDYWVSFHASSPTTFTSGTPLTELPIQALTTSWIDSYSVQLSMAGTTGRPRLTSSVLSVTADLREVTAEPNAVPEPGTLALLGLGLLGVLFMRRRGAAVTAVAAAA